LIYSKSLADAKKYEPPAGIFTFSIYTLLQTLRGGEKESANL